MLCFPEMRALLTLFILTQLIVACGPKAKRSSQQTTHITYAGKPLADGPRMPIDPPQFKQRTWTPSDLQVNCAAESCPIQVGALVFVGQARADNKVPTHNCTAFVIGPNQIMSNGHCDRTGEAQGYFITQKINGQSRLVKVTRTVYKRFTPHPKDSSLSSLRPDVAIFELEQSIGLPGLKLASGSQALYDKLIAYALFPAGENGLNVEKRECKVRRHESQFPYSVAESPDVIHSFDCLLQPGTSGSPMFAPGSDEVQAVHMGLTTPEMLAEQIDKELKRKPRIYEKHASSVSTNVRCLDLPGRAPIKCLQPTPEESQRRFSETQTEAMNKLRQRAMADSAKYGLRFKTLRYQLVSDELLFEVVYKPVCRMSEKEPAITYLIETVQFDFNEWAEPKPRQLAIQEVSARLVRNTAPIFDVEVTWPRPSSPHRQPELDFRKVWGTRFAVELPVCPR